MKDNSLSTAGWDAKISSTYYYWKSITPSGRLPGRQHLDPSDIPRLLPNIWLIDVQYAPRAYRWRLIGTEAQAGKPRSQPGGALEDHLEGEALAKVLAVLDQVVDTRQPSWAKGRPIMPHEPAIRSIERLILPLARDGTTVDMLLGATVYDWDPSRWVAHPRLASMNHLLSPLQSSSRC